MSATLIADIGELVTCDGTGPDALGRLADAALVVEAGRIAWIGPADRAPGCDRRVTVDGRAVIPGFVDSHTHLAFAGDRAAEFAARMAGASYDGGGISATVAATPHRSGRGDGRPRDHDDRDQVRVRTRRGERDSTPAAGSRIHFRDNLSRWTRGALELRVRSRRLRRAGVWADARRVRPARPLDRRVLRTGLAARLRRRGSPDNPQRRFGARPARARPRQPVGPRTRRRACRRTRGGVG